MRRAGPHTHTHSPQQEGFQKPGSALGTPPIFVLSCARYREGALNIPPSSLPTSCQVLWKSGTRSSLVLGSREGVQDVKADKVAE